MNLRQLSAELTGLLAEHPEYADHAVLCEDGEFEVEGLWCGDAKRNYPEVWLVGYDGTEEVNERDYSGLSQEELWGKDQETKGEGSWTAEEIEAAKARGLAMRDTLFGRP